MKIYHEYFRNTKVSTRAGVASFNEQGYAEVEQDIADVLKGLKGFRISEPEEAKPEEAEETAEDKSEETENDLSKLSFNVLKTIAEEKGIKVKTNKKSDLIEAIQALEK